MLSFSDLDILIVIGFLLIIISIGLIASRGSKDEDEHYLLSGRRVGLFLFILTNVATWYGGILGVGEFSYRYGLVSWVTQGFPYYLFALIFAFFLAQKIRKASLFTIPDKLDEIYGRKVSLVSAVIIFILVSPAPYLLILSQIIALAFNIDFLFAILISSFASSIYLIKGGYRSNIWADAFSFLVMFIGFILIVIVAFQNYGGYEFLSSNLPPSHLQLTGGQSFTFIIVWFLIALWTFTDPGFHQRCYSAKSGNTAKWGIVISVFLWFLFDFLTNTTGLYSKAIITDLSNPVLAFPYLADRILNPGLKGLFFAALIATVISTLNSFIFLSGTTFSRDFIFRLSERRHIEEESRSVLFLKSTRRFGLKFDLIHFTQIGIITSLLISIIIAYYFQSVVELWYTIGSICIPGLILPVISAYYPRIRINRNWVLIEIFTGFFSSLIWLLIRDHFMSYNILGQLEPMVLGLFFSISIHVVGLIKFRYS